MTGGSGLLGSEILKLDSTIFAPVRKEFDITQRDEMRKVFQRYSPDVVLHLAAATKPPEHEKSPVAGIEINIIGTANLALLCHEYGAKLVYVSTDYVYSGEGPHSEDDSIKCPSRFIWSKLGGESAVSMLHEYLILRLSFGPVPFPWEKVYDNQLSSKLYVDEIAPLILGIAKSNATGIINVGGPRMSLHEYAKRTVPDIVSIPTPNWVPRDTSLDISQMKNILGISDESKILKHGITHNKDD